MPARSTALMCTNTSFEPSLGVMNPKPFCVLKNLTVPVAIVTTFASYAACVEMRSNDHRLCDRNIRVYGCIVKRPQTGSAARQNQKLKFQHVMHTRNGRNRQTYASTRCFTVFCSGKPSLS